MSQKPQLTSPASVPQAVISAEASAIALQAAVAHAEGLGIAINVAWMKILEGDAALKAGLPLRPRLVIFGGGLPIVENGVRIGGIGVSGGSAEQDEECARAGLKAIGLA